jgi:hypothetical protein
MVEKVKVENPTITVRILETIEIIWKAKRRVLETTKIISIKSKKRTIEIRKDS